MPNIQKAQAARIEKSLNKEIRTERYGLITKKQLMERLKADGAFAQTKEKKRKAIGYDDLDFFTSLETKRARAEEANKNPIKEYRIFINDGEFFKVSKSEYEYFNILTI